MLFLVELVQIKHEYEREISSINDDEIQSVFYGNQGQTTSKLIMKIPSEVPRSMILKQQNSLKDQMKCLYDKYVKYGSDFEVNVSSSNRIFLQQIFENDNYENQTESDLFKCMDLSAM